ncbi:hypothetical protein H2203_008448 [Taxawa tesnikishii (nom. ined.)]|nr:hypothetical protein H2203_008448 [Dothideales sp. JES 119]
MSSISWNEALSGVSGSISLAAWVFLLVPQLIENYRSGSADGVSLLFLSVWMVGDITNLAGALWARLVPTVIALAVYFCFADAILISQCVYYNTINARRERRRSAAVAAAAAGSGSGSLEATEEDALLGDGRRRSTAADNMGLPGSRRRSSASKKSKRGSTGRRDSNLDDIMEEDSGSRAYVKNTISVLLIIVAGAGGWAIAWRSGVWKPSPIGQPDKEDHTPIGAEVLGYASAVCYLGARIPQIIKNYREKSCDGLSLLFFLLSLLGNLTYGAGILFHSVEKQYFLTNLPWLIGSLGTMVEDAVIFYQFSIYGDKDQSAIDV